MNISQTRPVQRLWRSVCIWGALWGLLEASLGYLLHLIPGAAAASGMLLFPLAFFCMRAAVLESGQSLAALLAALVAAMLKLLDFLLPNPAAPLILRPALAITLEGLAFFLVLAPGMLSAEKKEDFPLLPLAGATLGWRLAFAACALFWVGKGGLFRSGFHFPWSFLFLESAVNLLLIRALFLMTWLRKPPQLVPGRSRALPLALVLAAMLIQLGSGLLP